MKNNLTAERKEVPDNSDNYTPEELEVAKLLASSLTDNFIQARSHNEANEAVASPQISKKNLPQMKNS